MARKANIENLRPFKKGQSGNPNGRPRKGVSAVLSALEAAGHDEVTAEQVRATMGRMLNLSRKELITLGKRKDTPIMDELIARALVGKGGWDALQNLLDRAHGRPKQAVEHSGSLNVPAPQITIPPPEQ